MSVDTLSRRDDNGRNTIENSNIHPSMNIAITGEGIVSALGIGKEVTLEALLSGRSGVGPMRYLRSEHTELPVGEVPLSNADMQRLLGIESEKTVSRTALMAMLAIRQCVDEARLSRDGARILLVSGTTVGGMDLTESAFAAMMTAETPSAEAAAALRQHDCGACTRLTADYFGALFDDVSTVSTACSSAANAIMLGARLIEAGLADVVVAGGSEALSLFHLNGFRSLMILDGQRCRPFDASRQGLNLGEGAAYVVLESIERAARRGIEPHAYLVGYGNACDAYHQTATSATGEGATRAMLEALRSAGLQPEDIDYVNAHGTGTPDNDRSESAALLRVFGERAAKEPSLSTFNSPLSTLKVSSTKPFTGHATSAAGSIESVVCLLAMRHRFVPANIGWENDDADCIKPSLGERDVALRRVMCNSFGFGGNDTSLIFSVESGERKGSVESGKLKVESEWKVRTFESDGLKVSAPVLLTTPDDVAAVREYVRPLEARRMGKLMKGAYLAARRALDAAGIETPDAIITATRYGCLENSERILEQMTAGGESSVGPTLFMQSTHNTIGSDIAIRTRCHGYNITYTQGEQSLRWALVDAKLLIASGRCRNVLVGLYDEAAPVFRRLMGESYDVPYVRCEAMVVTAAEDVLDTKK